MKKRVLIADDDDRIREVVRLYLEAEGFDVLQAENGQQVMETVQKTKIHLVVLDLMMPVLDGWTVCKLLRNDTKIPIVMLTAKSGENDRVLGLDLGADDYIVKPFSPRELVARVKAILRRVEGEKSDGQVMIYPGFKLDLMTREVYVRGVNLKLTTKEYELLLCLAKNPGRIYSREQLLDIVWGYDYCGDSRTVDTHINRLRSKMESQAGNCDFIQTVRGVGYKFEINGH